MEQGASLVVDVQERLSGLMARVAARDSAALASLYDSTVSRLMALALRILRNEGDAEEAVSDAYLQVWRGAASYDSARGPVAVWLLMICRSRALDKLRARDAVVRFHGDSDLGDEEGAGDPLDLLAATRRGTRVHVALAALPSQTRQVLALAFFKGYSHQEISTATGLPLGTVKSQIRRGLSALRASTENPNDN